MTREVLPRGLTLVEFMDKNHRTVQIQESSSAEQACVWFGLEGPFEIDPETRSGMPRAHLTREMVHQILPELQFFADHGRLAKRGEIVRLDPRMRANDQGHYQLTRGGVRIVEERGRWYGTICTWNQMTISYSQDSFDAAIGFTAALQKEWSLEYVWIEGEIPADIERPTRLWLDSLLRPYDVEVQA